MRHSFAFASPASVAFTLAAALVAGCGSSTPDDGAGGVAGGKPTYTPFAAPANAYSHGEPTALEQGLLELVQQARANPPAEGMQIVSDGDPDVASNMKAFNVNKQTVINDFKTYKAVPPLVFNPSLLASSKVHSNEMLKTGVQAHNSPPCQVVAGTCTGPGFDVRITNAGYKWSFISENIFAFAKRIVEANDAFLVDWGNPDLGHRKALLDLDGPQRDIGISIVEMSGPNMVGPLIVTQDFGWPQDESKRYVLGVVYHDLNGNAFYDPGEGIAGFSVVPNSGDTFAVTSMSGGYAIPFPKAAGAVKVQVQTPDGKALDQKDTALAGDNVKVDFILP